MTFSCWPLGRGPGVRVRARFRVEGEGQGQGEGFGSGSTVGSRFGFGPLLVAAALEVCTERLPPVVLVGPDVRVGEQPVGGAPLEEIRVRVRVS